MTEDDLIARKDALIALMRQNEDRARVYNKEMQDAVRMRFDDIADVNRAYMLGAFGYDERLRRINVIQATFDQRVIVLKGGRDT